MHRIRVPAPPTEASSLDRDDLLALDFEDESESAISRQVSIPNTYELFLVETVERLEAHTAEFFASPDESCARVASRYLLST